MEIGSAVRIYMDYPDDWPEAQGQIGIIVGFGKRLHMPAAKVFVLGEVCEFDLTELAVVSNACVQN